MSQPRYPVYVLGAGCSVDYGYPLAKEFVGELEKYRNEQLLGDDCRQLRQAADETIELMKISSSPTIDRLLRIIDEDWHEPDRSRQPYDPSKPPYCRIEGSEPERSQKHEAQIRQISTNAKLVTTVMFLHFEKLAHEKDLHGYHKLLETIFPRSKWPNWQNALSKTRCHVLTFNYDRLFEMAFLRRYPQFESRRFPLYCQQVLNSGFDFWDPHTIEFSQDRFCFLKLHGSAGMWVKRNSEVEYSCGVPVHEPNLRINDTHFFGEPQEHLGRGPLEAEPLIVFPHEKEDDRSESGTTFLHREYIRRVWKQAETIVADASKIIVVGYSFDPKDRRSFIELLQKRPHDCKIVVWNLNADVICKNLVESYPELDGCLETCTKRF